MKVDELTSVDVHTHGGGEIPPSTGLAPDVLPEAQSTVFAESSQTGVSTRNALSETSLKRISYKGENSILCYAPCTIYSRVKTTYDNIAAKYITDFYQPQDVVKLIKGKRKIVTDSRLSNIFYAHGTGEQIQSFVYDNVNLPFLRFYYSHLHIDNKIEKIPMMVSGCQTDSLKIICEAESENAIVPLVEEPKFEKGQLVQVVDGAFKGVIERAARWYGLQRTAVVKDDLMTVCAECVFRENGKLKYGYNNR